MTGALDRFVSRLSSVEAPGDLRVALKTLYVCFAKKYARRAISSLAYMLLGELFGNTIRDINHEGDVDKLTPDGKRFLESEKKEKSETLYSRKNPKVLRARNELIQAYKLKIKQE